MSLALDPLPGTTVIRGADTVVAWDGKAHTYMPGADVAFQGRALSFVGRGYAGPAEVDVQHEVPEPLADAERSAEP